MKVFALFFGLVFSSSVFAGSPVGSWSITGIRCHLGGEYTQTPFDSSTMRIVWSFNSNNQYRINLQNRSVSYMERGNFNVNSARLCLAAYDGYSSEDGYRRYNGQPVCGSFQQREDTLTVLFDVRDPVGQGCPFGDLVELSYSKIPEQEAGSVGFATK